MNWGDSIVMDSKELLSKISLDSIVDMLTNYYDIEMDDDTDTEALHFRTDCHNPHNEGNFKLYLFKDSKMFFCYSCCGSMSLYDFIMEMENLTFAESVQFAQDFFKIGTTVRGFGRKEVPKKEFVYKKKEVDLNEVLPEYENYILNTFLNYHSVEWLYEGITHETMDKYEIMFDEVSEGIIIPYRDKDGRLIGIRQRNLDKRQLELKRKYVPYTSLRSRITYKHQLGKSLYGIYTNQERIKETQLCVLWESEKSVLLMDSLYGNNPSVAVGGSTISEYQLNLLKTLGVKDVYVAFDNENFEDEKWNKKLNKIYTRIVNFGFNCFVVRDWEQKYLDEKDSPIDKGIEVWRALLSQAREFIIIEE